LCSFFLLVVIILVFVGGRGRFPVNAKKGLPGFPIFFLTIFLFSY